MSRYGARPAFDANARYLCAKRILLNGVQYEFGDEIDTSTLNPRRVQQLYDGRKIEMVRPGTVLVPRGTEPAPETISPVPVDPAALGSDLTAVPVEQEGVAPETSPEETPETTEGGTSPDDPPSNSTPEDVPEVDATDATGLRVVKLGLGGWQIVNSADAPIGSPHPTKKAAEAERVRLLS